MKKLIRFIYATTKIVNINQHYIERYLEILYLIRNLKIILLFVRKYIQEVLEFLFNIT